LLSILLGAGLAAGVLEPVFYDLFKEIRNALPLYTSSLLQLTLKVRRETPVIDCGLHALQCSAGFPKAIEPSAL
jgi:hypothetical protein